MSDGYGYRGYLASRPVRGQRTPQHVQNLVIRDYAQRHGLAFKLSAAEYAMPSCYMVLEAVLDELDRLEGIICFSLFMLPERPERRAEIYRRVLRRGRSLHGALEGLAVRDARDVARLEDIFLVDRSAATALPDSLSELAHGLC
jgi:sporadic carbohydrate cluster protein (TIGR04323 family)